LIIVDEKKKILVYKGTNIEYEKELNDIPISLAIFYPEVAKIRIELFQFSI